MDCLRPGDVADPGDAARVPPGRISSTPMDKGLNVFMEKPVAVDAPTVGEDVRAGQVSRSSRNQKVGVGP